MKIMRISDILMQNFLPNHCKKKKEEKKLKYGDSSFSHLQNILTKSKIAALPNLYYLFYVFYSIVFEN